MIKFNRSNRHWNRSQRRRYQENDFDAQFDWNRPLNQSCYLILCQICSKDSIRSKSKLLAYLNLFTKYCQFRYGKSDINNESVQKKTNNNHEQTQVNSSDILSLHFFCDSEILCCLRVGLLNEVAEVRAASLRAIRYFVQSKKSLHDLIELNIHHLIARSLDIVLDNRVERIQSMRLLRHLLAIEPNIFPIALARCLCSLAYDNYAEKDTLLRVCWATISELTILNPVLSARSGCINILIRCTLNALTGMNLSEYDSDLFGGKNNRNITNNPNNLVMTNGNGIVTNFTIPFTNFALSEAMISSFLYLYNYPETRRLVQPNGSDLYYFISSFTDLYSFYHASKAAQEQKKLNEFNFDEQRHDPHHPHNHEERPKFPYDFDHNLKDQQLNKNSQQSNRNSEQQRTLRYLSCKNAILSLLRSWPGCFFMCRVVKINNFYTNNNLEYNSEWVNMSRKLARIFFADKLLSNDSASILNGYDTLNPLESLVSLFHLPYAEIHHHLLGLFYELFGLKLLDTIEDLDEAIKCVYFNYDTRQLTSKSGLQSNKNYTPDEWQLYDGFISKEAEDIIPSLAGGRLNFIINHQALLLQSLIECGILEGLLAVILESTDQSLINQSTILLGELIHLSGKYLPQSSYAHRCQSLPTLVAASVSSSRERRNRALMTMTSLIRIQDIKKQGPQPSSLFLEQQIFFKNSSISSSSANTTNVLVGRKKSGSISKMQDENVLLSIKNSNVLRKHSFRDWNWDIIIDILKQPYDIMLKLEDKDVRSFCIRLVEFYSPSKRQFSSISKNSALSSSSSSLNYDTSATASPVSTLKMSHGHNEVLYSDNPKQICSAAIYFFDFLLQADENRASDLIKEFLNDLDKCLKNISNRTLSSEDILIPSRLLSTLSQKYFLLLGRFSHYRSGRNYLKKTHIFQHIVDLIHSPTNEIYTKLIISSFDYNKSEYSRNILSKVLTSSHEPSKIYATKFMRLLLRLNVIDFNEWGINLLINQLYDQSTVVSLEALDILDEACSENVNHLIKVLEHRPALQNLGDKGILFYTRFASFQIGIEILSQTNTLNREIDLWRNHFNLRYVRLVEDCLNECFTCHQKSITGKYGRRPDRRNFSHLRCSSMTAHLVPHFYGQLAQTYEGLQIISQNSLCEDLLSFIHSHINSYIPSNEQIQNEFTNNPIDDNDNRENREFNIFRLKSALWAIGHIGSSDIGIDYLISCDQSIINLIITLVEQSTILSLRATGFYVICLFGSTLNGAEILSRFGWLAIQHSHHDCFPIDQQHFENFHLIPTKNQPFESMIDATAALMTSPKIIESVPAEYFSQFIDNDDNNLTITNLDTVSSPNNNNDHIADPLMSSNATCQFSISSNSSSGSNNYPSILPTSKKFDKNLKNQPPEKLIENDHLQSSIKSFNESNTSSITSLNALNPYNTITRKDNRLRSSSDCNNSNVNNNNTEITTSFSSKNSKPEYQDSGILNQSYDTLNRANLFLSPKRNRKISAPCFPHSPVPMANNNNNNNDDKIRHDSYGSGHTNSESRSTSFTDYSTTSNQSNTIINRNENSCNNSTSPSSLSFGPRSPSRTTPVPINNRQQTTPLLVVNNEIDPYPSPVDAFGYAQLIAIQKRRVNSLSGNMFFNSSGSVTNSIPDSYPISIDSINTDTFVMDLYQSKNSTNETFSKSLAISNRNNYIIHNNHSPLLNQYDHFNNNNTGNYNNNNSNKQRTLSGCSQQFNQSEFDNISNEINLPNDQQQINVKSSKFMCLCLPKNLSLMFHLEENKIINESNKSKKSNVDTLKTNRRIMKHVKTKCLLCCKEYNIQEKKDDNDVNNNNNNENSLELMDNSENIDSNIIEYSEKLSVEDIAKRRLEILRLVSNLSLVMYAKQSEQELLSLKQQYPKLFDNYCLYSDVCMLLERNSYKATARRFLQELFMDIIVDEFYKQTDFIMKKYEQLKPIE